MATPIISGAISLLLEKYPYMTPKDVKIKLKDSANNLNISRNIQGFGELNMEKLLQ